MKRNDTTVSSSASRSQNSVPNANFLQRERIRRSKLATFTIPIVMLFLLTLFPQAITNQDPVLTIALFIGLGIGIFALLLARRGLVKIAGILTLIVVYAAGTFTMLHYPGGLTASDLYLLDFTIIPDILVLAFFSVNSLLPIACISAIQAGAILLFGPHDSTITHLLQTTPLQIFSHIYAIQIAAAVVLYLWTSSIERKLAQAELAEEKDWQKQELEQKHQLDEGIQQILQTHVAVANGDLNARTPLVKGHELWQVASALNNLIARYQKLSHTERKLRQHIAEENQFSIDQYQISVQDLESYQTTGEHLKLRQFAGGFGRARQDSSEFPRLRQDSSEFPRLRPNTRELPKLQRDAYLLSETPKSPLRQTRRLSNPN